MWEVVEIQGDSLEEVPSGSSATNTDSQLRSRQYGLTTGQQVKGKSGSSLSAGTLVVGVLAHPPPRQAAGDLDGHLA